MAAELEYPTLRYGTATLAGGGASVTMALQVGTGGAYTSEYYRQRGPRGYAFGTYASVPATEDPATGRTPAEDLAHVRRVLRAAIADLARALGVSRQAVYDWQNGKPVAEDNAARLADLARAADVFSAEGLMASAQILRRPILSGKNLFDIVREGGSAEDAAIRLAGMVRRELRQRQVLAERLAGRKRPPLPSDGYGIPMLNE
ncbi:MAG: hypothetical protein ACREFD_09720 [Stellaceae bacterium]